MLLKSSFFKWGQNIFLPAKQMKHKSVKYKWHLFLSEEIYNPCVYLPKWENMIYNQLF